MAKGDVDELVYAAALDIGADGPAGVTADALRIQTHGLLAFAQALGDGDHPGRIWILIRNARAEDAVQGALVGLARTIALERPDLRLVFADLGDAAVEAAAPLIAARGDETELLIRGGEIFVPKLERKSAETLANRIVPAGALGPDRSFALALRQGALTWTTTDTTPCGAGEVQVEVRHAGLNFRDIMAVTGMLPTEAERRDAGGRLGLEFAGRVCAVGDDVRAYAVGDRVLGLARGALAGRLTHPAASVYPVPDGISMAEAAALPVAALTAHYALNILGRLKAGERVLIHNATGGVGLAAVAVARAAGAEIFATAGSAEKRDHLASMGPM